MKWDSIKLKISCMRNVNDLPLGASEYTFRSINIPSFVAIIMWDYYLRGFQFGNPTNETRSIVAMTDNALRGFHRLFIFHRRVMKRI